jgi:hypothetical protein
MVSQEPVPRPARKTDFTIVFDSRDAEVGWRDLLAVRRNALADAWDFLTATPLLVTPLNYRLRDDLAFVIRAGELFERWQLKLNQRDGARIWFYVVGNVVHLEKVFVAHPNETK